MGKILLTIEHLNVGFLNSHLIIINFWKIMSRINESWSFCRMFLKTVTSKAHNHLYGRSCWGTRWKWTESQSWKRQVATSRALGGCVASPSGLLQSIQRYIGRPVAMATQNYVTRDVLSRIFYFFVIRRLYWSQSFQEIAKIRLMYF